MLDWASGQVETGAAHIETAWICIDDCRSNDTIWALQLAISRLELWLCRSGIAYQGHLLARQNIRSLVCSTEAVAKAQIVVAGKTERHADVPDGSRIHHVNSKTLLGTVPSYAMI